MRRLVRPFILHNRVCFPKPEPSKVLQQNTGGRYQCLWLPTSDSDGSSARLESETTAPESEAVRTLDKFTGTAVNSGAGGRECHAGGLRKCSSPG